MGKLERFTGVLLTVLVTLICGLSSLCTLVTAEDPLMNGGDWAIPASLWCLGAFFALPLAVIVRRHRAIKRDGG